MVIPTDPPEVNWGDDAWCDDPRTKVLLKDNEEFRGIIAKLPKTKDGVPVVPYTPVWLVVDGKIEERVVQWTPRSDLFADYPGWFVGRGFDGPPVQVSESYSTREAAWKALEAIRMES